MFLFILFNSYKRYFITLTRNSLRTDCYVRNIRIVVDTSSFFNSVLKTLQLQIDSIDNGERIVNARPISYFPLGIGFVFLRIVSHT